MLVLAFMVLAPRAAGDTPPTPTTPTQTTPDPVTVTNPTTDVTPAPDPAPKKTPAPKKAPPTSTHSAPVDHSTPSSHPATLVQPAPTVAPAIPVPPAHAATSTPRPTAKSHARAAPVKHHPAPSSVLEKPPASPAVSSTKPVTSAPSPVPAAPDVASSARVGACDGGASQHAGPRLCRDSRHRCSAVPRSGVHSRGPSPPPHLPPPGGATPAVDGRGRHFTALGEPHPVHAQHVGSRSVRRGVPRSKPRCLRGGGALGSGRRLDLTTLGAVVIALAAQPWRAAFRRRPTVSKVSLPIGLAMRPAVGRTMAETVVRGGAR